MSFLYIFHLFHPTINIIKKGANVLQNVSKIYLPRVYKNESGLSSVEAAAAAAATEAWWAAILSLRSECNLFKFSIWLAPPEIISGIYQLQKRAHTFHGIYIIGTLTCQIIVKQIFIIFNFFCNLQTLIWQCIKKRVGKFCY